MGKIGYARVSTKDQNLSRQFKALEDCEKIFFDKASGKTSDRAELKKMLGYIRENDIIVVQDLDRLSRNNSDLTQIISYINSVGATLEILSFPSFNGVQDRNLRLLLNNLILEIFKYQAESERIKIKERQRQGIELAKKNGVYKGRQREYDLNSKNPQKKFIYTTIVDMLIQRESVSSISTETGVSKSTIYRIKKRLIKKNILKES